MCEIAVLMTCFNRCTKTIACLDSLFEAIKHYNFTCAESNVNCTVFLTDDGCSDGTPDSVMNHFPHEHINIIQGDGSLYWAGGMRKAWQASLNANHQYKYFLLLNDDTVLTLELFVELFATEKYSINEFGKEGIVSGITSSVDSPQTMTYGGSVWVNRFLATTKRLEPLGKPQLCDLTNANILLVPSYVVDILGIFYKGYHHGNADYDYSYHARKKGIPVLLTAQFCGRCNHDHMRSKEVAQKVINMSFAERRRYFSNPVYSNKDYLLFVIRVSPFRAPFVWLGRMLNLFCPKFYYYLSGNR